MFICDLPGTPNTPSKQETVARLEREEATDKQIHFIHILWSDRVQIAKQANYSSILNYAQFSA